MQILPARADCTLNELWYWFETNLSTEDEMSYIEFPVDSTGLALLNVLLRI